MTKWDIFWLRLAEHYATMSKDPSTKVGAVIAKGKHQISQGFNGYPSGIKDNEEDSREIKYEKTIHAEMNAILFARQDLTDCTLYVTPLIPCSRCAAAIVQTGISRVVVQVSVDETTSLRWSESNLEAEKMFLEVGILMEVILK